MSAVERCRAEAALAEFGKRDIAQGIRPISADVLDEAEETTEDFLRTVPLDAEAQRFLVHAGQGTFRTIMPQHIDAFYREGEDVTPAMRDRLYALLNAASRVHAYQIDPNAEPELHHLLVLVGTLDETVKRHEGLARAKTEYTRLGNFQRPEFAQRG